MLENVIELVNKGREVLGLTLLADLPKGEPAEAYSCPLANAFNGAAVSSTVCCYDRKSAEKLAKCWGTSVQEGCSDSNDGDICTAEVRLPNELVQFVNEFDDGKYPQYEVKND